MATKGAVTGGRNRAEYITSGYLREQQKLSSSEYDTYALFQNVPEEISILCALYYKLTDYFEIINASTTVSNENKTINKITHGWKNTCYGTLIPSTDKCIYKWWLKIPKTKKHFVVGIASAPFMENELVDEIESSKFYMIAVYAATKLDHTDRSCCNVFEDKTNTSILNNLEEIALELNLKRKQLILHYADNKEKLLHENIECGEDINYRLAISMLYKDIQISIQKFEQLF